VQKDRFIVGLNAYRNFKNSIDTARDEGRAEDEQERLKLEQRMSRDY